jgi:uncharacterized protein YjdB
VGILSSHSQRCSEYSITAKVMVQNMKRKNYEYSKGISSTQEQETVQTNLEINNYEYRQGHYAYKKSMSSSMKVKECGCKHLCTSK